LLPPTWVNAGRVITLTLPGDVCGGAIESSRKKNILDSTNPKEQLIAILELKLLRLLTPLDCSTID
jgi:hypothetical protein